MAKITKVSPLAPAGGLAPLPVIKGARFATTAAGVRYSGRTDVMMAWLQPGSTMAGVFTSSSTRAAPVLDCEDKLAKGSGNGDGFAILVNSGNANAFTGRAGVAAVATVCKAVANATGLPEAQVFTASTGVIGEPLPAERIAAVIADLSAACAPDGLEDAARAIMTTDTFAKGASTTVEIDGHQLTIAGIAKGSGMIAPDMATMLAYVFTDAAVSQPALQQALSQSVKTTFNAITVDSDTSTSDTAMLAATGAAQNPVIEGGAPLEAFTAALHGVLQDLALQIVRDGEGATKLVKVQVQGAADDADADRVARAIANSPLVKTAIAGEDPNWGRIVMAVGKSGAQADRDLLSIRFGDITVAENGWVAPSYSEAEAATYMKEQEIDITVDLGLGVGAATIWTCDLTHDYIAINADYRS